MKGYKTDFEESLYKEVAEKTGYKEEVVKGVIYSMFKAFNDKVTSVPIKGDESFAIHLPYFASFTSSAPVRKKRPEKTVAENYKKKLRNEYKNKKQ